MPQLRGEVLPAADPGRVEEPAGADGEGATGVAADEITVANEATREAHETDEAVGTEDGDAPKRLHREQDGDVPSEAQADGDIEAPQESLSKPLLASEALMEDLAPMEPARGAARAWGAAVGVIYLALGVLSAEGLRPGGYGGAALSCSLGVVVLAVALTRINYRQRAVAMLVTGTLVMLLGLGSSGPAISVGGGGPGWGAARALAVAALPAALTFRARYRAYAGARWLLVAAFAATLPFLGYTIARFTAQDEPGIEQVGAFAVILSVAASLLGFMGAETTGAGAYLAAGVISALTIDLALAGLASTMPPSVRGAIAVLASAVAFAATSVITSIGLFQVLAWRLAADARRIDLHPPPKELPQQSSNGDWLS